VASPTLITQQATTHVLGHRRRHGCIGGVIQTQNLSHCLAMLPLLFRYSYLGNLVPSTARQDVQIKELIFFMISGIIQT